MHINIDNQKFAENSMTKYFYAYHGPDNNSDFDPAGGYGVSQESKQKKTSIGDLVYVIQRRRQRDFYELCGLYKITGHYYQASSKRPYRLRMVEHRSISNRIPIDEAECSNHLPLLEGDERWSNFQRHFCRQGVSLQSPLKSNVVAVLNNLINKTSGATQPPLKDLCDLEFQFNEDVNSSALQSREERIKRLSSAEKVPERIAVSIFAFVRNPDVVAEVLFLAKGICRKCGQNAPFSRSRDGSPYLEVHHRVRLADGGEDTVENAMALCPNCHREMHFGV